MTTYSLLFIDADERIDRSKQIDCSSNEQAIHMAAKELGDYSAIQIWDRNGPIGLIGSSRRFGNTNLQKPCFRLASGPVPIYGVPDSYNYLQ